MTCPTQLYNEICDSFYLAALLQSEYIFIIHIFKFHYRIVKKILHLNLKFNRYSTLVQFEKLVIFTNTGFETDLFLKTQKNIYSLKHLILLIYRVKLCMTIKKSGREFQSLNTYHKIHVNFIGYSTLLFCCSIVLYQGCFVSGILT